MRQSPKTPKKTEPKHSSLKAFAKLFIGALVLAGFTVLFIKYYENYIRITDSRPAYIPDTARNIMPSNAITPNKKITPLTSRKNNKTNNANVMYENANSIKEMPQKQDASEVREQQEQVLKERATIAFQSLQNEMLQTAQQISRSRHKSSNLAGCSSLDSDFTVISQTLYDRLYKCRMKGNIIGIRTFEVGVKVRGEISIQEDDFISRIVNSVIIYDREL